jgi:alpha-tubulin suppressor-like RCC1 family protein
MHLTVTGNVFGIGRNNFGQLGNGQRQHATEPVTVQTEKPVSLVSVGGWHTLFRRKDGVAMSVGRNDAGQLADGSWLTKSFPRKVMSDVTAVSAGYYHSLFLKSDGTVYAAGNNEHGQLGVGDYGMRNKPALVASLSNVTAISAGECHSLFVRVDGTVWGTGCNEFGQLGDGTTLGRSLPSQAALQAVTTVYGGVHKSLFVRTDNTVWAAGQADDRLGHNPGPDWPRSTPVQIATSFLNLTQNQKVILGNTVFATDMRFPPSDPFYATGLPNLVGLGWNGWNYR